MYLTITEMREFMEKSEMRKPVLSFMFIASFSAMGIRYFTTTNRFVATKSLAWKV
jgi:hypothetical protein